MSDPLGPDDVRPDDEERPKSDGGSSSDEPATVASASSRQRASRSARLGGFGAEEVDAGHYRILSEIARGGMGVVFRGRDVELCRDVAIKVVHEQIADEPALRDRFIEEAQIGGQLQHPGIVPVYELGVLPDERPYFAMKLVKGETLSALMRGCEDRAKEQARFVAIFESICQTMAYAHSRGVIHRDLKPSNVMVGPFGEVQLVDWGLAKVISEPGAPLPTLAEPGSEVSTIATIRSESMTNASGSVMGSVMGTVGYMSPEQARGEIDELDERADVFSLGGILCEILTGKPPYPGKRPIAHALASKPDQTELRERLAACSADPVLVELARDCLAPVPDDRPQDAGVVAERAAAYLASVEERAQAALVTAAEARGKAAEERKARRLAVGLACSAVLSVVIAAGGWAWWEGQQSERERDTELRVSAALSAASFARGSSKWSEAQGALTEARAHLEAGLAGEGLRSRVTEEERALAAAREEDRQKEERRLRRLAFNAEVVTIRGRVDRTNRRKIAGYSDAFAELGIDVGARPDPEAAQALLGGGPAAEAAREQPDPALVEAIRGTGAAVEMADALVDWARLVQQDAGGPTAEARRLIELALAVDDEELPTRLRRALLENDRQELARFAEAEDAQDLDPMTAVQLAEALWGVHDELRAFAVLERTERRHPDDFHLQVKLATRHMNKGRLGQALPHVKAAHALLPESSWALAHMGILLLDEGKKRQALDYLVRAVDADPENEFAWNRLGICQEAIGDLDAAIDCFYTALDIAPDYIYAIRQLASALDVKGRSAEATELFREAIELDPADAGLLNDLAWHLATANDPEARDTDEALELADTCVAMERSSSHLNTQGVCRYRVDDLAGCVEALESSILLSSDGKGSAEDLLFLAMAKHKLGELDEARRLYDAGRELIRESDSNPPELLELERYRLESAGTLGL